MTVRAMDGAVVSLSSLLPRAETSQSMIRGAEFRMPLDSFWDTLDCATEVEERMFFFKEARDTAFDWEDRTDLD